jgi:putative RecB family exonuclease
VDWKTAASSWSPGKADRDLQATCFCYAYNHEHRVNPYFRFDVITKTKQPKLCQLYTERNADAFARFEAIVLAVEQAVNAGIFLPAEKSHFCGDCPYANRCKSWHHKQTRSMFLPLAG